MAKKSDRPVTKTKNPEPDKESSDWVIWAAWADRITFEEIQEVSGLAEAEVIALMRRTLKRKSFKLWRKRASYQSIKHRRRFQHDRKQNKRIGRRALLSGGLEQEHLD